MYRFIVIVYSIFILLPLRTEASEFVSCVFFSDTLIIDNDTIYIEHEEVILPNDSLPAEDFGRKNFKKHFLSASLYSGLNISRPSFQPTSGNLTLLDDFIENPSGSLAGWTGGLDCAARFIEIQGPLGTLELAGVAAFNFNRLKARYTTLENPQDLLVDSVLAFNGAAGELEVLYLDVTEPPDIGEVDSIYPRLNQELLTYTTPEFSAKLRVTLNRGQRPMRYFMETGIIHRTIKLKADENEIYLLNSSGNWTTIKASDMKGTRMLVPHFALGAEFRVPNFQEVDGAFFTMGAAINASLPMATISNVDELILQIGNFGIALHGRYFF